MWEWNFIKQVSSTNTISGGPALLSSRVTTVPWPQVTSSTSPLRATPGGHREPMHFFKTEKRGKNIFKTILCFQNKLALGYSWSAARMYRGGKRINSTWPSNLITTHSTAALPRPPAPRWGTWWGLQWSRRLWRKLMDVSFITGYSERRRPRLRFCPEVTYK